MFKATVLTNSAKGGYKKRGRQLYGRTMSKNRQRPKLHDGYGTYTDISIGRSTLSFLMSSNTVA